ncbi:hypothetical protein C444_12742 [Haloarcula japonica DSM 6131]|uniref:Uncharacterized protein n=1 Tax=Haloarcula japonica (strain ATCC 49778 / DSM 6131 / JCM 7785 / NBRC 101032 / NCIMB 13157 / TR-1) TaxID=1227453 RepID=M0L7X4_HALJT|nr:hypothetical protein C444_12742 [Haloarcula japonica DSM 6131]
MFMVYFWTGRHAMVFAIGAKQIMILRYSIGCKKREEDRHTDEEENDRVRSGIWARESIPDVSGENSKQ